MKFALIGYGAMGKLIRTFAEEKKHQIAVIVHEADAHLNSSMLADKLRGADAAIDFTVAEAVQRNVEACLIAEVPLVEGTTGWNSVKEEIERSVRDRSGSMLFGANFSIGVNLFYRMVSEAAALMAGFPEYEAFVEERHHSRKKDAPSGTALKLKQILSENISGDLTVTSTRAGNIPGTHTVGFDGPADQILLTHTARSREGFAAGALLAAEWIVGKKGFYEFTTVIDKICDSVLDARGD